MLKVGSLAGGRLARFLSTSSYPPRPTNIVLRASPPASRILKAFASPLISAFKISHLNVKCPTPSAISFVVSRLSTGRTPSWYVGSRNLKAFGLSHSHDRISTKVLEVEFNNGETYSYSAEFLRVQSPSAEGKRPTARGEVRVVAGRRLVAILSVEPVGNYAIRILFDDLHTTGIYTWNYLHSLGQQKFRVMREYLKALKQQGLSRDPLKKVASAASR